ncbi:alpha/beta hydrolase-fold protein [Sphingomonas sp. 1P06PA]|uniref:alpha/beta hydrolase n=1 Tax=Sphingomonas sp. 1P06PA TaxID=554121 RepID=UPI0039A6018C
MRKSPGKYVLVGQALLMICAAPSAGGQLPIERAAAPAQQGAPIVVGQSYTIKSKILGDARRLNVWLPSSYGKANTRYPVLVLLDGGVTEDFLHIVGLAQITSAYGRGRELIVIGVEGVDRRHDLSPKTDDPADLRFTKKPGGADNYRRFLAEEVKPWVSARYSTNDRWALIGESMAGLFVLDTLANTPAAFNDYIAVSPIVWWNRQSVSRALAGRPGSNDRRVFVAFEGNLIAGANGPTPAQEAETRIEAAFRGLPNRTVVRFADERHDAIYQPAALAAFRTLYALGPAAN